MSDFEDYPEIDAQLDAIFDDVETVECDHARNPSGRPTGKHYSDFDIFVMQDQIRQLVRQREQAAIRRYIDPCLTYCRELNGLDCCKNCGLVPLEEADA